MTLLSVGLLLTLLTACATTETISVFYGVTDLSDTIPGQDLWQYQYFISDYSFNKDYGFTIYFDNTLYSHLESLPAFVNSDWDPIVSQPDTALPGDGAYDALALKDEASFADPFTVSFVWLGEGTPGSQNFVVYDTYFDKVVAGNTAPEPATIFRWIRSAWISLFKKKTQTDLR
jgi:hypothetical protein